MTSPQGSKDHCVHALRALSHGAAAPLVEWRPVPLPLLPIACICDNPQSLTNWPFALLFVGQQRQKESHPWNWMEMALSLTCP